MDLSLAVAVVGGPIFFTLASIFFYFEWLKWKYHKRKAGERIEKKEKKRLKKLALANQHR